ncbi:hypothetical protein HMPREF0290_1259 [Corynebacterium efficiens YS-314]|uniref:Histidine kinase/HSP90-like ATPase domain-containing protein n=1 Tax=Corynebacterium efficiens (strain DSM 44549 / YS-314 / AJ 12310 / JCM 11189 / NBRC 100395) TaxID=196164 RepID=Q8FQB6_COREF|nr:hypothetical protein HMPREF0290_1259 [Corynebacterium efficiens YS-314]BAC18015.1 hypothetical protein [Corynebacterium efficiens YS-314]
MDAPQRVTRTLQGKSDLSFVDEILDGVEGLWEEAPHVTDENRMMFMLAVSEIATNLVKHNEGPVSIWVTLSADHDRLEAILQDDAEVLDINWEEIAQASDDDESGRGMALVRSVLHEFHSDGVPPGNRWTLVRNLGHS